MSKSVNHNVPHLTTWFNSALATLGSILSIYIYDFFFFFFPKNTVGIIKMNIVR